MKKSIILFFPFMFGVCMAQGNQSFVTLTEGIRKAFNYDTLSNFSCENLPIGLYAIQFNVDKENNYYDFKGVDSSLPYINSLLIEAVKKSSLLHNLKRLEPGNYLQLIYYTNQLGCNPSRNKENLIIPNEGEASVVDFSIEAINRERVKLLGKWLQSIEKSVQRLNEPDYYLKEQIFLPVAYINNENPNKEKGMGFRNDIRPSSRTKEEIEDLERKIQIEKEKRKGKH